MHHAIAWGAWHVRDICSSNLESMYVCVCPHYRGVQYIRVVDQVSFITGARSRNVVAVRKARAPVAHQEHRRRSEVSEEEFERRQALVKQESFCV